MWSRASVCLSVCLSAAVRQHYCTDPDVTWGRRRGCPLVVHYWADLQSVHRLRSYGNTTRTLVYVGCGRVAGDGGVLNITAAAWTAGFQWWRSGDITRMQNVSKYMLVLALCLVIIIKHVLGLMKNLQCCARPRLCSWLYTSRFLAGESAGESAVSV